MAPFVRLLDMGRLFAPSRQGLDPSSAPKPFTSAPAFSPISASSRSLPRGRGVGWRGGGNTTKPSSNYSLWKPDWEKYSRRVTVTERLLVTFSPTGINLNTHTKKQMFLKGQSGGKKHFQLSPLVPSYKSKSLSRVHKDTETHERAQGWRVKRRKKDSGENSIGNTGEVQKLVYCNHINDPLLGRINPLLEITTPIIYFVSARRLPWNGIVSVQRRLLSCSLLSIFFLAQSPALHLLCFICRNVTLPVLVKSS